MYNADNEAITPPPTNYRKQTVISTSGRSLKNRLKGIVHKTCVSFYNKMPRTIRGILINLRFKHKYGRIAAIFEKNGGCFNILSQEAQARYITVGHNVRISYGARIETLAEYGGQQLSPKLIIEDGVVILPNFTALVEDTLLIKRNTLIAENCSIITNNHGMDAESPLPYGLQPLTTAPVSIGEECWIGQNVTILSGVEIGKRCIIAAGAIVNKSIPPYTIAAGIPAKVIKKWNFETHKWESL